MKKVIILLSLLFVFNTTYGQESDSSQTQHDVINENEVFFEYELIEQTFLPLAIEERISDYMTENTIIKNGFACEAFLTKSNSLNFILIMIRKMARDLQCTKKTEIREFKVI